MTAPLLKQTRLLGLPLTLPFFEGQSGMKTSSANRQTNQLSLSFVEFKKHTQVADSTFEAVICNTALYLQTCREISLFSITEF